ncbi:MAG: RNA polymerase sigma factor [Halieaceae bacterium]
MRKIYRQWVEQYQDDVWSLARYLLKDQSEAEDACQEVFISLWRHQESVAPASVKPWLMKVTRNECFDRLRRRRPQTELEDEHMPQEAGPMSETSQGELSAWLAQTIAALGEPYRSLVILRDVQQHSYADVAQTLDMSPEKVKVYLYRARRKLRQQLVDHKL